MKKFAVLLTMIFVFAGSAQARISSSRTFAHFPSCTDGLVKKMCVCRSKVNPLGPPHQLLSVGMVLPHLRWRVPTVTAISGRAADEGSGAANYGEHRQVC